MSSELRALIVEDSAADARLLVEELRRGGYQVSSRRVDSADTMQRALDEEHWDIIICDHHLPRFTAVAALGLYQERSLDLPFIIVSGTIGEETAVAMMKAGAHDYIMKQNLTRFLPAIERELRDAEVRRAHKAAEQELERLREELENRVEQRMPRSEAYGLTFRELTVLELVAAGKSDKEIGAILSLSPLTAHKHVANILEKMGAHSRSEASARAVREGLVS